MSAIPTKSKEVASLRTDWGPLTVAVGRPVRLSASRIPSAGVRVVRRYASPLAQNQTATLAYFDDTIGSWRAVPSRLSSDRRSVSAVVHHLSVWTDIVSSTSGAISDAADWAYYQVGKVFDTRVDPPTCQKGRPDWVLGASFIETQRNNPLLFCVGADPKRPDLLVVKARVNRGFGYTASFGVSPAWTYLSTNDTQAVQAAIAYVGHLGDTFAESVAALMNSGQVYVGPGAELDVGIDRQGASSARDGTVVVIHPPTVVGFLVSTLAQLVGEDLSNRADGLAAAIIAVAGCYSDLSKAHDPGTWVRALTTCVRGLDDTVARQLSTYLLHRGRTPADAGKAAGRIVGRVSIYLGLLGPVFSAMNFAGERTLADSARSVSVSVKPYQTATRRVVIEPFTSTGLASGWSVTSDSSDGYVLDCFGDEPSPNAVGPSTHWCGSTADAANACWGSPESTSQLWCLDAFDPDDHTLTARPVSEPLQDTAAPADPQPLFLELKDGSRWAYRIGGAADGRADGLTVAYYCANKVGFCASPQASDAYYYVLSRADQSPVVDTSGPTWRVSVGLAGADPSVSYPAPTQVVVTRAWFIAGHRWSGDG